MGRHARRGSVTSGLAARSSRGKRRTPAALLQPPASTPITADRAATFADTVTDTVLGCAPSAPDPPRPRRAGRRRPGGGGALAGRWDAVRAARQGGHVRPEGGAGEPGRRTRAAGRAAPRRQPVAAGDDPVVQGAPAGAAGPSRRGEQVGLLVRAVPAR